MDPQHPQHPQPDEQNYRTIFDASENAILVIDWDTGRLLDVNRKACEYYGYSREELLAFPPEQLGSGLDGSTIERGREYLALAREDRCPAFEWQHRHRDGTLHWSEVRLKPVTLGGKRTVLSFSVDITARKQVMEALATREEQYRMIFEASSDAMFVWDRDLRVIDCNQAGTRLFRRTRESILSRPFGDGVPKEYIDQRYFLVRKALQGETSVVETMAFRHDGTSFEAELRIMPFTRGGLPQVLVVVRDIGERRAKERALQRSEARLRATVEASFDAVIAMDQTGCVLEFNAAAERIFGYSRDEALGRLLSSLVIPERLRAAHEAGLERYRAHSRGTMVGRLVETIARRKDGTELPVELAISVATAPEGNIFVGHVRDISARREAEAERTALEAQLRQAQKMEAIGQLTGGIAHDFNNILTSVMGYVVMAQERAGEVGDPALVRQLGQAHLASERARDLIAQMLAFARRQKGDPRALALTPLMRQTLRLLRSTLPSSISLDAQWLDADSAGDASWVMGDPVQLEQILFNLCINARDAMDGKGKIVVRLGRREGAHMRCASCRGAVANRAWVELRVADTGSGIAPELLDRIFDPFFSTKAPGAGSGMGLAMVHGIVHDHGGHVLVETAPGQGACLSVLLPPTAPQDPFAQTRAGTLGAAKLPTAKVLLAEDDVAVGNYLQEQLTNWGLDVTLVRDPAQAVHLLADAEREVRLLMTDLTMPGMTGLQLAEQSRILRPSTPVLLVTGNAAEVGEDEIRASGVSRVLKKPLDAATLKRTLAALLG
ncbi:PAS domain-containing hybrid sensor histidine kinase/response regulator [Ramlibacter albus]|uniref:histidine kinase n=1 Tax=Ramlibacter albus TaxID=2079448 RepID=A0A923S667_9BURK|nr:PAS domain S-box protein [Ramlibacter albus]MBC5765847.1 PAS domain S-box protein [Ramlibacter albus]